MVFLVAIGGVVVTLSFYGCVVVVVVVRSKLVSLLDALANAMRCVT